MGRLINEDVLIQRIYEYQSKAIDTEDIIHSIKTMPTAYDVERVVAELEEQLLVVEIEDEHIVPESDVDEYFELDVVPMVYAREIVRKGGV